MNSAGAAAAAAAARRRREQQEEEQMTGYSPQDLEGWEFKIVRSLTGSFKRPDFLQQVLEQEGRAGWTLIEKFDNCRIRLKRPSGARAGDRGLGIDAYRSHVGMSELQLGLLVAGCVLSVVAIILITLFTLRHG